MKKARLLSIALLLLLTACSARPEPSAAPAADAAPALNVKTAEWNGLGSLRYDSTLAQSVETISVAAVPPDPNWMAADWHPAYAQFRFTGYAGGQVFQLPYPLADAQVMVFHTADFPAYTNDTPLSYPLQLQALKDRLERGFSAAVCANPSYDSAESLPFLPWVHADQAFCARAAALTFQGGRGIRYLTHYTQDISPVLDPLVFYTFQGLTGDGEFYISAVFPVQTGVFPREPQTTPVPVQDLDALLAAQLSQLNTQPDDAFTPSLRKLDAVIQSLTIR